MGKAPQKSGATICIDPKTIEERLSVIEAKIEAMTDAFYLIRNSKMDCQTNLDNFNRECEKKTKINKDGIPFNTVLIGMSYGYPYMLTVIEDGYLVQGVTYQSLSAAAEAVSGCRRSGWTFWKLPNGSSVKEVFKDVQEKDG